MDTNIPAPTVVFMTNFQYLVVSTLLILMVIWVFVAYTLLLNHHYDYLSEFDFKIQTLILRLALMVPSYMMIFVFVFFYPEYYSLFEVFESIVDGYCIYCFYRVVILAGGGWAHTCAYLKDPTWNVCICWQRSNPLSFMRVTQFFLEQFLIFRPLLMIGKAVGDLVYNDFEIVVIFQILSMLDLGLTLMFLFTFLHAMVDRVSYIKPIRKVIFVKGLLFILALENLVVWKLNSETTDIKVQDAMRDYFAILVLSEVFLLSFLNKSVFGCIEPRPHDLEGLLTVRTGMNSDSASPVESMSFTAEALPTSKLELLVLVVSLHRGLEVDLNPKSI